MDTNDAFEPLYISTFATASENTGTSAIGDWAFPKNAPQQIAPTIIAGLIPRAVPIPTKATPSVPIVVQEDPVNVLIRVQKMRVSGSTDAGEKSFTPQ